MPYIVGPGMDWTVNDGLYSRFLKWNLKCENILECELAILPEARKCKKVLAWSGDVGLDQYISWNLQNEELSLETIWKKFEEFCKPQANELRARFDLLTSFRQAGMSVDEWYNAEQTQVAFSKYPPETAQILQRDIFWFFLKDESLVSKTLNVGHVKLEKFPASKVRQMAKKLESLQSTARHIKMSCEPQANQINLLRHQRIDLPPSKFQRKQNKKFKQRQPQNKKYQEHQYRERKPQLKERFYKNSQEHTSSENRCTKCGDSPHIEGFRCPASRFQCKNCHKYGHFSKLCFKKNGSEPKNNIRKPKAHQLMVRTASVIGDQSGASYSSSDDSFCLQMQTKYTKDNTKMNNPQHLVTNIEYKLKPHRRRTKFLRTKIDTCSNVNLMPISVYKLLYKDQDYTKLEPSTKAAVKTYTTDKIKIVGSCKMFLVHPDTRLLHKVTFQATSHEGSVIVSCATSLELGLIHPSTNLDELPEECSLIYSKADMPKQKRNKNTQAEKYVQMWPKKPATDMQSEKPAISSRNKKQMYSDKKCQETKRPKKPKSVMQSLTKEEITDMR